jgi:integrase
MFFIFAPSTGCRIALLLGLEIRDAQDDFTQFHVTRQKKGAKPTTELKSIELVRSLERD